MDIGWGEFFALASAFSWAWAIILFRRAGDALPPFELNLFKNLLGFSLVLPTMAFFEGYRYRPSRWKKSALRWFPGSWASRWPTPGICAH